MVGEQDASRASGTDTHTHTQTTPSPFISRYHTMILHDNIRQHASRPHIMLELLAPTRVDSPVTRAVYPSLLLSYSLYTGRE
jgi:hypothetical protein